MLLLKLHCPHCRAALTDGDRLALDGFVAATHEHGRVLLSAVFGDHTVVSDLRIPAGSEVEFRCPACEAGLNLQTRCKLCGAAMVSLQLAGGEALEFCSRRGCRAHSVGGVGDVDQMMAMLNRMLETPYD